MLYIYIYIYMYPWYIYIYNMDIYMYIYIYIYPCYIHIYIYPCCIYICTNDISIKPRISISRWSPGLEAVFHHLTANSMPAALRELRSLPGYDRASPKPTTNGGHVVLKQRNEGTMIICLNENVKLLIWICFHCSSFETV